MLTQLLSLVLLTTVPPAEPIASNQSTGTNNSANKPNIVYLLIDDLGRNDCGFMGGTEITTPNIDRLAKSGAILDAHYVLPVCSPTRAALMTGRYPIRHGLQSGVVRPWADYGLPLNERTMAQMLQSAGYKTAIFGKWHLGHFEPEYLPTKRGFDRQFGHYNGQIDCFKHTRDGGFDWHRDDKAFRTTGEYSTDLLANEACAFVSEHAGKKPFFMYVPFNAVHNPLQSPPGYVEKYPNLKANRRNYAAMLTALDDAIGRIVATLDQAGVRDNTLIVFSSDNGGPSPGTVTDNGKYRAGKGTLYEGGVRVAACATWANKIKPGSTIHEPVHMVDWYPTFAKLAGATLDQPTKLDGLDIWPVLTEGKPSPHESILINSTPAGGAIRAGDWKLVMNTGIADPDDEAAAPKKSAKKKKNANRPAVELFNLKADPYETNNLADKESEKVSDLKRKLADYAQHAVPPKNKPRAPDFKAPKVWGEKD